MAERPVFIPCERTPFYRSLNYSFTWNSGFAVSQSRKNIAALHAAYLGAFPEKQILEISSKSLQENGSALSAFNLEKYVPSLGKSLPVEQIYQASKVFEHGGPYTDLLESSSKASKKDERLKNSGCLIGFCFEGVYYPNRPTTAFYNYIYMNALLEHKELMETVLQYDAFTDIAFSPSKSVSCQAAAAAAFTAIAKQGKLEALRDFDSFLKLLSCSAPAPVSGTVAASNTVEKPEKPEKPEKAEKPEKPEKQKKQEGAKSSEKTEPAAGMTILHKVFGRGRILRVQDGLTVVSFPEAGEKTLGTSWCRENCELVP